MINSKITGTGSYIPSIVKKNTDFLNETFLNADGTKFNSDNEDIISKFKDITGIEERRYSDIEFTTSELGFLAAQEAIADAKINPEELDYVIFGHNFGDIQHDSVQSDSVPSLASRVKHKLGIDNPNCVAYDLLFGCPGWIQGLIQAQAFIKAGIAKKCLVIGAETLSRVVDKHDRDSMIYSDGAGACIVEACAPNETGILSFTSQSYTKEEAYYLYFGRSYNPQLDKTCTIKMYGRKIYEFALSKVPIAMKEALDKSGVDIDDVKKILIHQANEKMDEAMIQRFYKLYKKPVPEGIMPMSIHKLGNSSVATVPTLLDLILKNKLDDHRIEKGDIILLASVGAGMNLNAMVCRY